MLIWVNCNQRQEEEDCQFQALSASSILIGILPAINQMKNKREKMSVQRTPPAACLPSPPLTSYNQSAYKKKRKKKRKEQPAIFVFFLIYFCPECFRLPMSMSVSSGKCALATSLSSHTAQHSKKTTSLTQFVGKSNKNPPLIDSKVEIVLSLTNSREKKKTKKIGCAVWERDPPSLQWWNNRYVHIWKCLGPLPRGRVRRPFFFFSFLLPPLERKRKYKFTGKNKKNRPWIMDG